MRKFYVTAFVLAAACSDGAAAPAPSERAAETPTPGVVVDSAIPIPEAIRRFQAPLDPVNALADGDSTLAGLVRRLVAAYAERDSAELSRLALTATEFGYLYYPESPYPHPPYELSPDLLWYMAGEAGARGASRARERLGGRGSAAAAFDCGGAPRTDGLTRVWGPCLVTVRYADGAEERLGLLNAVAERDGRFKAISLENEL